MKLSGTIQIDSERKTVSITFSNGSYCLDHYTHGIMRFLDEEMECLQGIEALPVVHELSPIIPTGIGEVAQTPKGWLIVND
jgi:hypothetical protein